MEHSCVIIISLGLLFYLGITTVVAERVLVQTNLVYRHGDRAPIDIYPSDVHQAADWHVMLGELTQVYQLSSWSNYRELGRILPVTWSTAENKLDKLIRTLTGKEQQTRLGEYLRRRYSSLLSTTFRAKEIYVRSSGIERTLLSAYSNLAGLYGNSKTSWQDGYISWQPVPVHMVAEDQDEMLRQKRACKVLDDEVNRLLTDSPGIKKARADLKNLISLVAVKAGYGTNMTVDDIDHTSDTLFCEKQHGMSWPSWATYTNVSCPPDSFLPCANRTVYDIIRDLHEYLYDLKDSSDIVRKFLGGPLLMDMIGNMKSFSANQTDTRKFYMYSAHDTTVASLLSSMEMFNHRLPPYTATLMLDLYRTDADSSYDVEVWYKNVTDSEQIYKMDIPGCLYPCSLTKFSEMYQKWKISDWDKECDNNSYKPAHSISKGEIITISVCLALVLCMAISALICYSRRRRVSRIRYSRVPTS